MAKTKTSNNSPKGGTLSSAVKTAVSQQQSAQMAVEKTEFYQGPIPDPSTLEKFNKLIPGSADRIFALAEGESLHRRNTENRVLEANILAQQKNHDLALYQTQITYRTDTLGQVLGFVSSVVCVVAAIYLALHDQSVVAGIVGAVPSGALVRSFFFDRKGKPPQSS